VVEAHRIKVDPRQSPVRLDKFLMDRLEKVSRNIIQNGIADEHVLVNGEKSKASYKVRPNDLIQVFFDPDAVHEFEVKPEEMPLDIRYEDGDLIVLHKPPGLVVHPGVGNWTGTLVNGLTHYLQRSDLPVMEGNPSNRPCLVHRIDKDTSGLLVVAKNDRAMAGLAKQFFDHSIEREYIALVWGTPEPASGTIEAHIGRHPTDRLRRFVFEDGSEGKHAVTHYELVEDMYYVSLVKCRLETGRTHQIRVHMAYKGHPLFNDYKYGGDSIRKGTVFSRYKQFVNNCFKILPRHGLHARSLGFIHPSTGERMVFECEMPDDMTQVVQKWRDYVHHQKSKI